MAILPPSPEGYDTKTVQKLLENITDFLLLFAGAVAMIYLILGAYHYFTAFGNEEKAAKAKATLTWAIIGIIVIILAKVIVNEVLKLVTNNPPAL